MQDPVLLDASKNHLQTPDEQMLVAYKKLLSKACKDFESEVIDKHRCPKTCPYQKKYL